jgi:signal transduction histidine kinase
LATGALAWDLVNQTKEDLEHQGALVAMIAAENMDQTEKLSGLLLAAKKETLSGIRVTNDVGVVVASSGDGLGQDLSGEEEIRTALMGSKGHAIKPRPEDVRTSSRKFDRDRLNSPSRQADVRVFVAVPVKRANEVVGAVILSRTPREEIQAFWQMAPRLWVGVVFSLVSTTALSLYAGWRASRSLKLLSRVSERIAAGNLADEGELAEIAESRIAETAALAGSMHAMAARLRARLAYISEFAGNVSHEFKTPVSSLRGTVELLKDDETMPPAQRLRFLDNALADLDRLSRLVGGLLRLARAEEGGTREPIDLDELAAEVVRRYPGVEWVAGQAGTVALVREQVEAALINLVENARRHGGNRVVVETFTEGKWAGLRVIDDGPGIDPANLSRLFERFFTTDRAKGGTGLGLALVRAVAEAHGGTVAVQSSPGTTRFALLLARAGAGKPPA